ncbi:MAG: hypothetical protein ACFFDT_33975, partial [Candidatus Hodarchaeota archaeon]
MGYGIYDGLVQILLDIVSNLLAQILGYQIEFQESLRSTLIDAFEMTTILLFLIVNTILLIWLERKVASGRAWTARGPVFVDFNYGHFFGKTWKFGLLQN